MAGIFFQQKLEVPRMYICLKLEVRGFLCSYEYSNYSYNIIILLFYSFGTSNQFGDLLLYGVLDSFTDYPLAFF